MAYIDSIKGYVIDVPEIWLKRNDGHRFHFDQITSSNVSPDVQFMELNGGWSKLPVAYLPGQSTLEMTFESVQFDSELFALASNQEFTKGNVDVVDFYEVTVNATTNKAVLETPFAVAGTSVAGNPVVSINGMTSGDTAAAGVYTIADSTGGVDGAAYETELGFYASDNLGGKTIQVYVERTLSGIENIVVDNEQTFVGECLLRWPVYSSGDEEARSAGGVKGYLYQKIFKVRCTGQPGLNTQYKQSANPGITVAAMDPHRKDGGVYQYYYVEK